MEVTFANNSNRIYFNTDGEDGGTIAAADSSGNPLETGASVGHGADVTFTAEPEGGYMVESWTVMERFTHGPVQTSRIVRAR